ncbi:MAG: helix-turn-helix domain-containing protein [Luteolibacter sp.]
MASQPETTAGESKPGIFIPAALDDLGLSSHEFRVYCHLCRRHGNGSGGGAFPSVKQIAKTCRIHADTIWHILARLEEKGLIRREIRFNDHGGQTSNRYIPVPLPETKGCPPPESGGCPPYGNKGYPPLENEGCPPPGNEGYEGIPSKDIPPKEIPIRETSEGAATIETRTVRIGGRIGTIHILS